MLGCVELVICEPSHSHATGTANHIRIEPTAITSTRTVPAAWRWTPTRCVCCPDPACVLIIDQPPRCALYPISGPPGRSNPSEARLPRLARPLCPRLRRRRAVVVAAAPRDPRDAPGQRRHEDE